MGKAKSPSDLFGSLPKSRYRHAETLPEPTRKRLKEWIDLYLNATDRPTVQVMARAMTEDLGIRITENYLRNRINEAKRDNQKV